MTSHSKSLEELIGELPPDKRAAVRDFVETLVAEPDPITTGDDSPRPSGLEQFFGCWDSGDENSADNERIDADLAREYASTHDDSGD
jgi:hypothetical protein